MAQTDSGTGEAGTVTEFPLPTPFTLPTAAGAGAITTGPDCNLWFLEANKVGRITPSGAITEFPIPTTGASLSGIVAGPDGNLWFAESGDKISRITTAGAITEFSIPDTNVFPTGMAAGSDGRLWFIESPLQPPTDAGAPQTENAAYFVGAMTTSGVFSEYPIVQPADAGVAHVSAFAITSGPDGALWFLEQKVYIAGVFRQSGCYVGRISTSGQVTDFPLPPEFGCAGYAGQIISGPGGHLWFAVNLGRVIPSLVGMVSTSGTITMFGLPVSGYGEFSVDDIAAGPDGNVWLVGEGSFISPLAHFQPELLRMTPSGTINDGINLSEPSLRVTAGPDGNIWFTERNAIGRLTL
jgi:streptogramin lyase